MAATMLMLIILKMAVLPPLISQLFSLRLFKAQHFYIAWLLFVWISLLFVLYKATKPANG